MPTVSHDDCHGRAITADPIPPAPVALSISSAANAGCGRKWGGNAGQWTWSRLRFDCMRSNVIDLRRIRLQSLGLPPRLRSCTLVLESGRSRLDDGSVGASIESNRKATAGRSRCFPSVTSRLVAPNAPPTTRYYPTLAAQAGSHPTPRLRTRRVTSASRRAASARGPAPPCRRRSQPRAESPPARAPSTPDRPGKGSGATRGCTTGGSWRARAPPPASW